MKRIGTDHFKNYKYPAAPLLSGSGALAYRLAEVDMRGNRYKTSLRLRAGETDSIVCDAEDMTYRAFDGERLLIVAPLSAEEKKRAKKGLPQGCLYELRPGEEKPEHILTVDKPVIAAYPLCGGRWLLLCKEDLTLLRLWGEAKGDAAAYLKLKKVEDMFLTADETPFRTNADGWCNRVRRRLYLWDDGELTLLTPELASVGAMDARDGLAVFCMAEYTDIVPTTASLWRLDLETLRPVSIDPVEHVYTALAVTDGGRFFAARNDRQLYGEYQDEFIDLLNADGRLLGRLNESGDLHLCNGLCGDIAYGTEKFALLPGGDAVYVIATVRDEADVCRCEPLTGDINTVAARDWFMICDLAAANGRINAVAAAGMGGPELYALENGEWNKLTAFNDAIPRDYASYPPERSAFVSSDGSEVNGYVIRPRGFEPGKKYPTLLYIHGGPNAAYGTEFYHETQLMADSGYAVTFCNPHGSEGYGAKFADLRGKYYTIDYDDLMLWLDTALERYPFLDADRLGVIGGSYGGMMVNYVITHNTRFKAAVSDRCCCDELLDYFSSDIGLSCAADTHGGGLWDGGEESMWEAATFRFADRVVTPTLFVHGENDFRCTKEQAIIMFAALKYNGVPARLFIAKGENHDLCREGAPTARKRRLQEILDWFGRYL